MDYTAFLAQATRGQLPGVVLVHGADGQLLDDALGAVGRRLFPDPALALLDREIFDGRETAIETIVNAARTLPLQAATRLVVVRHAQALPARPAESLARYAATPNPAAVVLLLADEPLETGRDRKRHWLLEAIPAAGVVDLGVRRGRQVEEWLRQRAAVDGLTVSDEAARVLVQWVGEDGATLLNEVRKAALAGGPDNRAVGITEVTAVVGEHRVHGIFELTRAVERRELGPALKTLDRLLATEDVMFVLAVLGREIRTAWTVRQWRERGLGVDQISRMLRRPPAAVERLVAAVSAEPRDVFGERLVRCWEAERRLKSGGEPRAELAALVTELCGTGR